MRKRLGFLITIAVIAAFGPSGVTYMRVAAEQRQRANLIGEWYTNPPILGHIQYIYKFAADGKLTFSWKPDGYTGGWYGTWKTKGNTLIETFRHETRTNYGMTPGPTTFTTKVEKFTLLGDKLTLANPDGAERYTLVKVASNASVPVLPPDNRGGEAGFGTTALAFSPDGRTLAELGFRSNGSPSDLHPELRLWDLTANRLLHTLSVARSIGGRGVRIVFSPDGHSLACSGERDTNVASVTIWDLRTYQETTFGKFAETDLGGVAFSPDGKTLAVGGARLERTDSGTLAGKTVQVMSRIQEVYLLDTATHALKRTLEIEPDPGNFVNVEPMFSPDGKLLAAAGVNGSLTLWDTQNYHSVRHLTQTAIQSSNNSYCPLSLNFSPDGRSIAEAMQLVWAGTSIGYNPPDAFLLWDTQTGKLKMHRKGSDQHDGSMYQCFLPSGEAINAEMISSRWADTPPDSLSQLTIRLWGRKTPKFTIMPLKEDKYLSHLVVSPDGNTLALSAMRPDGKNLNSVIELWDLKTRTLKSTLKEPVAQ